MFLITFSEGNGRAELEKNTSNDAFVCDDEAHIVVLCPWSPFFCTRWVLLRSKKTTFKIHLTIKGEKMKYKKPSREKMRKTQNEWTSSSKNDEYHILGQNSDFRGKSGILELKMPHPGPNVGHFKCRDSPYVVHFKCRDCPYVVHFKRRDCPYVQSLPFIKLLQRVY